VQGVERRRLRRELKREDVKQVRKLKLRAPEPDDWANTTPTERLAAVWELTCVAQALKAWDRLVPPCAGT
jgi:hypothetical protein